MTENNIESSRAFITQSREYLGEQYLPQIERCLETLREDDIWWRAHPSSNSIGNLLLHLAGNVRQWIVCGIGGAADERERQKEFDEQAGNTRAELLEHLKQTLSEVDRVLAGVTPAQLLEIRQFQGHDQTVQEAIYHVVEHFSMHTGQIILLAKMLSQSDLRFFDFSSGVPVPDWNRPSGEQKNEA